MNFVLSNINCSLKIGCERLGRLYEPEFYAEIIRGFELLVPRSTAGLETLAVEDTCWPVQNGVIKQYHANVWYLLRLGLHFFFFTCL